MIVFIMIKMEPYEKSKKLSYEFSEQLQYLIHDFKEKGMLLADIVRELEFNKLMVFSDFTNQDIDKEAIKKWVEHYANTNTI